MWGEDYIFEASQSVIRGQRFLVVDIERGACDFTGFKRGDERALLHDGAARSIDQVGRRFHRGEFVRPDKSARAFAQDRVDRQEIGATEEFLLLDALYAQRIRVLDRQVFAPGDYVHHERFSENGHLAAEFAEAENSKHLAVQAD